MTKEPFSITAALSRITRADDQYDDGTLEVDESMEVDALSEGALVPKRVRDPDLTALLTDDEDHGVAALGQTEGGTMAHADRASGDRRAVRGRQLTLGGDDAPAPAAPG